MRTSLLLPLGVVRRVTVVLRLTYHITELIVLFFAMHHAATALNMMHLIQSKSTQASDDVRCLCLWLALAVEGVRQVLVDLEVYRLAACVTLIVDDLVGALRVQSHSSPVVVVVLGV